MIPKILCTKCSAEITPADKFCASCGTEIDWGRESESPEEAPGSPAEKSVFCRLCGHENSAGSFTCESCGSSLGHGRQAAPAASSKTRASGRPALRRGRTTSPVLRLLQSWKVTLGLGVVFVAALVILGQSKNPTGHVHDNLPRGLSGQTTEAMAEIDRLQKVVESNPGDMESTLRLANLLHDVKFMPRAITMYQRYLQAYPTNPDARVDLGICYFELALADSGRQPAYLDRAKQEMKKALEYDPKHQLACFNLGIVTLHSGDIEESNVWFKRCIDLNPASETGKRAQELYNQHQSRTFLRD